MTGPEMLALFRLKADRIEGRSTLNATKGEIYRLLNDAQMQMLITTFTGNRPNAKSFEENEKRRNDLRNHHKKPDPIDFVASPPTWFTANSPSHRLYPLPQDYAMMTQRLVNIRWNDCLKSIYTNRNQTTKVDYTLVECRPIPVHTYGRTLDNPQKRPSPLRPDGPVLMLIQGYAEVDCGQGELGKLDIRYLAVPIPISDSQDCTFPSYFHREVVNQAVIEWLEPTQNPRYGTFEREITKEE